MEGSAEDAAQAVYILHIMTLTTYTPDQGSISCRMMPGFQDAIALDFAAPPRRSRFLLPSGPTMVGAMGFAWGLFGDTKCIYTKSTEHPSEGALRECLGEVRRTETEGLQLLVVESTTPATHPSAPKRTK